MKTIWKFDLPEADDTLLIEMPRGASLLTVEMQHGRPRIWAVVDPDAPKAQRVIYMRGTGHPMQNAAATRYIGTIQLADGALVFHFFDGGEDA